MDKYFCYGTGNLTIDKFKEIKGVNFNTNKIEGGVWASPKTDLYSDWFIITLAFPRLVRSEQMMIGCDFELSPNAKVLTLDLNNYKGYVKDNILDLEALKKFDAVLYSKELVDNVDCFKSYYVESLQVFNFDMIINCENDNVDNRRILSEEFREKCVKTVNELVKPMKLTGEFEKLAKQNYQ